MNNLYPTPSRFALGLALALAAAATMWVAPAAAGSDRAPELATVSASPSGLAFEPFAVHEGMTLTISNGEVWLRQSFGGGESPFLQLVDGEGEPLADGTYLWELRAGPRALDLNREQIENARFSADGEAAFAASVPAIEPQFGSFSIVGGALVDPNQVEPEPVRGEVVETTATAGGGDLDDRDGSADNEQ